MRMEDAQTLRARMRGIRAMLGRERQTCDAQAVFERLRGLDVYREARVVMAYMAVRGELSVRPAIADVLASGRVLALPRCEGSGIMRAYRVRSLDELCPGAYGIPEPTDGCEAVAPEAIDLILVPGAAYDGACHRVGQGGGYYDRFLPRTRAWRVGICHDFALVPAVPHRAHDAGMDAVVTPSRMITRKTAITQEGLT